MLSAIAVISFLSTILFCTIKQRNCWPATTTFQSEDYVQEQPKLRKKNRICLARQISLTTTVYSTNFQLSKSNKRHKSKQHKLQRKTRNSRPNNHKKPPKSEFKAKRRKYLRRRQSFLPHVSKATWIAFS